MRQGEAGWVGRSRSATPRSDDRRHADAAMPLPGGLVCSIDALLFMSGFLLQLARRRERLRISGSGGSCGRSSSSRMRDRPR